MVNLKNRRQSKNIIDIRSPENLRKYNTKTNMGNAHADRVFTEGKRGDSSTDIMNQFSAKNPHRRVKQLSTDKPKTKPKNMQTFKKK